MIYKLAIAFSIIFIMIIIKLVHDKKIDEKYSILWIFTGIIVLVLSIFPNIIVFFSEMVNVYYPPSLMFLLSIIILGTCLIHISVVITKQNKMIVRLNQEIAILKEKINETEENKKSK